MSRNLNQQVIVITGASSGIGAATAIECARAGMNVVINARRADRLEAVAEQVRAAGGKAETVVGDVTDQGISDRMLDAAEQRFDRLDAVFANAGYGFCRPAHEVTVDQLRHIFEVDFFASVDLVNAAAKRMIARSSGGHLLMCSSCLAKFTLSGYSAYSAAKAAQNHICRAMNVELEPHRIHVSSVHPITTRTEFFSVVQGHSGRTVNTSGAPGHASRFFVQSSEHVARAIVKCLRRPRPEVWTSFTTRAVAAVMTLWPGSMDLVMRKVARADEEKGDRSIFRRGK
ncbi:MAG: SDR family oxidoreductase [Planctomycetota bacterium]|nr:MAG: SDR family oxidoreductase [Planctomycetota bacterium]